MYLDHYGLKEAPFSITPDPRFVFLSDRHRDALAHLIYGISQGGGGGFVQLTGEVGTGKTTLSRLLLEQLPENTRVALVLNPRLQPIELLEAICQELHLDIAAARGSGKALVDTLNRHLLEAHAQGLKVVLILDEAQQLPVESLEQVRLLTNLETATHKLLQIVLLGQPELREVLQRPDLRQLAQRITARYHLTPLDAEETAAYVRHRLAVAGLKRGPFSERALRALHRWSGGVPRLINVIAERALLAGYARDLDTIEAGQIDEAAGELLPPASLSPKRSGLLVPLAIGLLGLSAATAWIYWRHRTPETLPATPASAQTAPASVASMATLLRDQPDDNGAARDLLSRWNLDPGIAARVTTCPAQLDDRLHCLRSRGSFGQLAALDRPVLLLIPDADGAARPWALLALNPDTATLGRGGKAVVIARAALEPVWPGEYLALFSLPAEAPGIATGALPDWAVAPLARFEANRSLPALSDLKPRILRLQQMHGLRADGVAGQETWWVLSAYLDTGPRLRDTAVAAANR